MKNFTSQELIAFDATLRVIKEKFSGNTIALAKARVISALSELGEVYGDRACYSLGFATEAAFRKVGQSLLDDGLPVETYEGTYSINEGHPRPAFVIRLIRNS